MNLADSFVKMGSYDQAIVSYKRAAETETLPQNKFIALQRLAQLYRDRHDLPNYKLTVKKLYDLGFRDEAYFKNVLLYANALWEKDKTLKENQDTVIFFAKLFENKDYLKDFLVWNKRFAEAVDVYETEWQAARKKFSQEKVNAALKIALWSNESDLKIRWMERSLAMENNDQLRGDLINLYVEKEDFNSALKQVGSIQSFKDYERLAFLYQKVGDAENTAATYWGAYETYHDVKLLEKAYFTAKDADLAIEEFQYLSKLANYKPTYAFSLAETYRQREDKLKALAIYENIWRKWGKVSALKAAYSLAYELKNKPKMKKFLRLLAQRTKDKQYLDSLATLYLDEKDYRGAEKQFLILSKKYPKKLQYQQTLGQIYIDSRQQKKALKTYRMIWKKWHDFSALKQSYSLASVLKDRSAMAEILLQSYEHTKNKKYLRQLAAVYSDKPAKLVSLMETYPFLRKDKFLGYYYLKKKDDKKAVYYFDRLVQKHPKKQGYVDVLVSLYTKTGQRAKIVSLYKRLYKITRNKKYLPKATMQLASLQKNLSGQSRQSKKTNLSIYDYKRLYRKTQNPKYLESLAYLYIKKGQQKQAVSVYKRLYKINPHKYDSIYLSTAYNIGNKEYEKALEFIFQQQPNNINHGDKLAKHYLYVKNDYSKAAKILAKLLQKTGKDEYRLMLAFAYGKNKQYDKKAAVLETLPMSKMSGEVMIYIAQAYQKSGRWQNSISLHKRWLKQPQKKKTDKIKVLKNLALLYKRLGQEKPFRETNRRLIQIIAEDS
jgi:predicted Zn-dependent protease